MPLRRLTNREYNNTVHDLLGDTTAPARVFASDRDGAFTFRRAVDVAVQDARLAQGAAETLAAAATTRLKTLLPCSAAPTDEAGCLKQFLDGFAMRAYRRPLTSMEIARLNTLFMAARDPSKFKLGFVDAIGFVIEGILQTPQFLYLSDPQTAPVVRDGNVVLLSPYGLASRLSYFLWGTMPDNDLFAAAAAGKLATPADIDTQARRLLADNRAKDTVGNFFSDWLGLDGLSDVTKASSLGFSASLAASMQAEVSSFVQDVTFNGDGRWSTLMTAPYSFVDQSLASVYGVTGVKGSDLQKENLDPTRRSGLLTQAGFLTLTGSSDGSLPPRRGKAVFTKFLCRVVPPPPMDAAQMAPKRAAGSTTRAFFEQQVDTNPCAKACHGLIDPIGYSLESYDGVGKYRTTDSGKPVDATGTISLDSGTKAFNGAVELSRLLAVSGEARDCFASQWASFAWFREPTDADQYSVQSAATAFAKPEAGVRELMAAVATSRSFMYRAPAPGEMLP